MFKRLKNSREQDVEWQAQNRKLVNAVFHLRLPISGLMKLIHTPYAINTIYAMNHLDRYKEDVNDAIENLKAYYPKDEDDINYA